MKYFELNEEIINFNDILSKDLFTKQKTNMWRTGTTAPNIIIRLIKDNKIDKILINNDENIENIKKLLILK